MVQSSATLFLNQATTIASGGKYYDAISMFELACELARKNKDVYSELRALDGLSLTQGKIILKEFDKISFILQVRSRISTALPRSKRIALEVSIKNIIYKLNYIHNLCGRFLDLSQSNALSLDEADRIGIQFSKDLILELTHYVKAKIKQVQQDYQTILPQMNYERLAFILKLGKAEA